MIRRRASKFEMSPSEYLAMRAWDKEQRDALTEEHVERMERRAKRADCPAEWDRRVAIDSILRRYHSDPSFKDKVLARSHARRAEKLGLGNKHVTISYLGKRDSWRCGICRERITDRTQASIDHIVPLSRGGAHELANVHIAHKHCNYAKNNRGGGEQLLLVG